MIHLENIPQLQGIFIPKGMNAPDGAKLVLTFTNTVDLRNPVSVEVTNVSESKFYYQFMIAVGTQGDFNVDFNADFYTWLPITNGEYRYALKADGIQLAGGLAIVGDYKPKQRTFNKEVTYKQYGEN